MAMNPVLLLGLGSTGAKIVTKLQNRIKRDGDERTRGFVRCARITSEINQERGVDTTEMDGRTLANNNANDGDSVLRQFRMVKEADPNDPVIGSFDWWWPADPRDPQGWWIPPVGNLVEGAGGVRPLGRLLLHYRCLGDPLFLNWLKGLRNRFNTDRIALPSHAQAGIDSRVHCYVFGLLAGGTCSGTLADIAYLLRAAGFTDKLMGVFLLGDVCSNPDNALEVDSARDRVRYENTLYALGEMMFLQCETGRRMSQEKWARYVGRLPLADAPTRSPYTKVTLVGAQNQDGVRLRTFEEYQDFIADYYGLFLTRGANLERIGAAVDNAAVIALSDGQRHPGRAFSFERIGLLNVRVPVEKIAAVLKAEVALAMTTEHVKNVDPERVRAAETRFQNEVKWGVFQEQFAPEDKGLIPEDEEDRPSSKEDFEGKWSDGQRRLNAYYAPWLDPKAKGVKEKLQSFSALCDQAVDNLINDLIAQRDGSPASFGSLKQALTDLGDLCSQKEQRIQERLHQLEPKLGGGNAGFENTFKEELKSAVDSFPGWIGLRLGHYPEQERLKNLLVQQRNDLRAYASAKMAQKALALLAQKLEVVFLARRLVLTWRVPRLPNPVFGEWRKKREEAFAQTNNISVLREELLKDEQDIFKSFVKPLLQQSPGGAAGSKSNRDRVMNGILSNWRAAEGTGYLAAFRQLLAVLERFPKGVTPEEAMENPDAKKLVVSLRNGLETAAEEQFAEVLLPMIQNYTVWDALASYVESVGDDPGVTLQNIFKSYAMRGNYFTKTVDTTADEIPATTTVYLMCNEEDAVKAFERLGLPSPKTYLATKLLPNSFEGAVTPLDATDRPRNELLLLRQIAKQLPSQYEGFEALHKILGVPGSPGGADPVHTLWSDKRFPEWFKDVGKLPERKERLYTR